MKFVSYENLKAFYAKMKEKVTTGYVTTNVRRPTGDTALVEVGYWTYSELFDCCTLLIQNEFWGNQHNSTDLITVSFECRNTYTVYSCTIGRVRLGGKTERTFYTKLDEENHRLYLFIFAKGGNGYGFWSIKQLGCRDSSLWTTTWQTNQTVEDLTEVPYSGKVAEALSVPFSGITDTPTTLSGYGCTDGVNTIATSGSGNVVTAASVSGHTLTLTKGQTFSETSHTHAVKINGTTKTISASGGTAVDLGTYLTSHQSLGNCVQSVTDSGSGDVVTGISKSGSALTVTKGYVIQHPAALLSGSLFTPTTLASSSCEKVTKVVMRTADSSIWWGLSHGALLKANMYGINSSQMCVLNTAKTAVMLSVIKYDSTKFWLYDHSVGKMVRLGTSGVFDYGDIAGTSGYHLWTLVADTSTNANGVQIKSCAGSYYLALTSSGVSVKTSAASPAWNIDVLTAVTEG